MLRRPTELPIIGARGVIIGLLAAGLGSAPACHLVVGADKYHVVEQGGEGGADAGHGGGKGGSAGTGGGTSTGGSTPSSCDSRLGCEACSQCTIADLCAPQWNNCLGDGACQPFAACVQACAYTQACWLQCIGTYTAGSQAAADTAYCINCTGCVNQCALSPTC